MVTVPVMAGPAVACEGLAFTVMPMPGGQVLKGLGMALPATAGRGGGMGEGQQAATVQLVQVGQGCMP